MNLDTLVKRFVHEGLTVALYLTLDTEEVFGGHVDISDNQGLKCRIILAGPVNDEAAALRALELKCMRWIAAWAGRDHSGQSRIAQPQSQEPALG